MDKNRLIQILLILLFFNAGNISAQNHKKYTGSLLWKISGKNLTKPSYILGTHHLADVKFLDSIPGLKSAQEETMQVVGEVLLLNELKKKLNKEMAQSGVLPEKESYKTLLSEEEYIKLDKGLKLYLGIGLDKLGGLHPALISTLYNIALYVKVTPSFDPSTNEAMDSFLQKSSLQNGKPVMAFETVKDQIQILFNSEPLQEQAKSLVCTVEHTDFLIQTIQQINRLYRVGDIEGIYDICFNNLNEPCPVSQAQKNIVLKDRNDKWLQQLPNMMATPSLIVVGALHLAGEEGLLNQLAKEGYEIEIVK